MFIASFYTSSLLALQRRGKVSEHLGQQQEQDLGQRRNQLVASFKSNCRLLFLMQYDLELGNVVKKIKAEKARVVCIQLPDGLKPKAAEIQDAIEKNTDARVIIWAGSCYGGCDIPDLSKLRVDLLIQWGHSDWAGLCLGK